MECPDNSHVVNTMINDIRTTLEADHFLHKKRTATVTIRVIGKADEFITGITPVHVGPSL